ncbi:vWA domain-containing protein [Paenibacillus woosongensis]|uniref:VWA domain-containing protein n=1 Tax=Paenibacillus woosongensis TaxID=307580 RepID=A0A7X3CMC5_9BACL|nr:VWA domain-containing protein [Paenibacillus woosongensis]MUG44022.1 VWA domain-containing protein [Paenibacillus woosongensis]
MGIASWSGLWFALAIPLIILMYLFKRKYVDTLVPSHMLWNRVLRNIEANRPWQKLQNRLLLWLQLLAAALLVLALMTPFIWVKGGLSGHTVIVVDASASMSGQRNGEPGKDTPASSTALDRLKIKVHEYIDSMGTDGEVTLLKLGTEPEVLLTRETDQRAIRDQVDKLEAEFGKAAYRETMSLAAAMTQDDPDASVLVFTDEQWSERADDISFAAPVEIVSLKGEGTSNAAIEQFGIKNDGDYSTGVAVIRNYGARPFETGLNLFGDGQLLASKSVKVDSGKAVTVTFDELPASDVYKIKLERDDDYAVDNVAYAFRERGGAPHVLLISEGNLFLEKALQLSGARVTRMEPGTSAPSNEPDSEEGNGPALPKDKPDTIIIDGMTPAYLKTGEWSRLIKETPSWTLGGDGGKIQPGSGRTTVVNHPVTRYISLNDPPAAAVLAGDMPSWGKPLMEIGSTPAAYAGTENGVNRLVFLFALSDGDLPLRPEFPVMVNNAVQWLQAGRTTGLGRMVAGAELEMPLNVEAAQASWVAADGYAVDIGAAPIPAAAKDHSLAAVQAVPPLPGLWRFEMKGADGSVLPAYNLEVIAHPSESAIGQAKPLGFGGSGGASAGGAAGNGTENSTGAGQISEDGSASPDASGKALGGVGPNPERSAKHSLTYLAALLALIVIIAEWGVYQRGRSI